MKEERKEKNRKSHTGSVSWSTGLLRYRSRLRRLRTTLGATLRYAGRAAGADSPEGLACASLRSVPQTLHPGPGRGRATQYKTRSLHVCVSMRG